MKILKLYFTYHAATKFSSPLTKATHSYPIVRYELRVCYIVNLFIMISSEIRMKESKKKKKSMFILRE